MREPTPPHTHTHELPLTLPFSRAHTQLQIGATDLVPDTLLIFSEGPVTFTGHSEGQRRCW